ncbi:hypothetical protein [Halorubrum amylolyticum]|uniref:hypothetical protein n=1 Tax=Halorubrum amylolyticum TaxID=2508724 RepID=UPI001F514C4D|nr:hypothetical protein [Halorubrum amylolyticum]
MVNAPRRRVLAAAATGSTLSLAGCGSLGSGGDAGSDGAAQTDGTNGTSDEGGDGDAAATVAVDIQEDLQATRAEVQSRLQEGNISREEAQTEIREAQLDLLDEAVSAVEAYAADTAGLAVSRTNGRAGAVLVSGDPAAVLGVLDAEGVTALLSPDDFPEPQDDAANASA